MTQPDDDKKPIELLIDLGLGDNSGPVKTEHLIQRRRYDQLRKEVERHLDRDEPKEISSCDDGFSYGSGWTFFLDGTRGAGKSTFLRSVQYNFEQDKIINKKLGFVALIDPSRIEHSEIVLLVILQQLSERVDKSLREGCKLESEKSRKDWREAFKGVAGGLALFAKDHHPLDGFDPDFFMDWGLERTRDSANLRKKLHHLFNLACEILQVKALMLAFDDADTDATHAINLLECIRKYLDTPRVMVLVTGDMELYSLLVRQHFEKSVTNKREVDRSTQYVRMIGHLEEQYLLKLFPVRRRMQLLPLWNLLLEADYKVGYSDKQNTNQIKTVQALVERLVQQGLRVKAGHDVALYKEFLLKQPLRSVLQVMTHCAPNLHGRPEENDQVLAWLSELTNVLNRAMQALALTSLYRFSVDTDAIAARELPALTEAVFDLSLRDGDLDTAPYLRPMSAEQDIKNSFVALAAEVPNFCTQSPGTLLRYLLQGPGSVSLYEIYRDRLGANVSVEVGIRRFKQYVGVGRKEDASDWARRATAVIAANHGKGPVLRAGVIGLKRGDKSSTIEKAAACFPVLGVSLVNVTYTVNTYTYASIFNIVGQIEKLLTLGTSDSKNIRSTLRKVDQILTISAPNWVVASNPDSDEPSSSQDENEKEEGKDTENDSSAMDSLASQIEVWLRDIEDLSKTVSPSAVFIGKVWTRLYFSLVNAAEALRPQSNFAGAMEIFALCVINAFLVEEAEHHVTTLAKNSDDFVRIDRSNPRTLAQHFVSKLKRSNLDRNVFPMTAIMATCPLLLGLLDLDKGYVDALRPFFPKSQAPEGIKALLRQPELTAYMKEADITGAPEKPKQVTRIRRKRKAPNSQNLEVAS